MKINGTNIIFFNERQEVLLHLRDNKPDIPYPNMWGIPGGHVSDDETPDECILREMKEELGLSLQKVHLFVAMERSYGTEHTYWARANLGNNAIGKRSPVNQVWRLCGCSCTYFTCDSKHRKTSDAFSLLWRQGNA